MLIPCGATLATICPACAERAKPAGRPVPGRLAPRERAHPPPARHPTTGRHAGWKSAPRPSAPRPRRTPGQDTAELDELIGELDAELARSGHPRQGRPRPPATARPPVDPPPPGHPGPAPAEDQPADGRQGLHRPGRQDLPAVDVPHPDLRQLRQGRWRTAPRPTRPATTTGGPRGMRCTSPRCSIGSSRTCAASSATTCSTSPPSNPSGGSPRTCTWPCAAPCPAPSCGRSSPPPTTRCGGPPPTRALRRGPAAGLARAVRHYLDPATGEVLPTWDEALDAIGPMTRRCTWPGSGRSSTPRACWPGPRTPTGASGYLTKYLTKQLADCHQADTDAQRAHADRLADALRYEPCSPTCANWLRYGIQPKNPRAACAPGACKGKAHRPEHLGYAGRRVLVSRKWSGKTLADHRGDRKAWLLETLGLRPPDPAGTDGTPSPRPTATTCPRQTAAARRRRTHPVESGPRRSQTKSPGSHRRSFGNREGGVMKQRDLRSR